MSSERHSFLLAIRAAPDDDTPRLVYADWLEEHGEPKRAELIRVEVGLARRPGHTCGTVHGDIVRCEVCKLLAARKRLASVLSYPGFLRASRGIIESIDSSWANWREHGDLIWERELPWKVRLTTPADIGLPEVLPHDPGAIDYIIAGRRVTVPLGHPDRVRAVLIARWPGIDFELPEPATREQMFDIVAVDRALRTLAGFSVAPGGAAPVGVPTWHTSLDSPSPPPPSVPGGSLDDPTGR